MKPTQLATETDYVKVAVVIDCEGNIQITGRPGHSYQLKVTVANTNPALPRWCVERFGGYFLRQFYEKKPPNRANATRWRIQSYPAADLLTKCLPHFIIKRPQAEIAIKFQATYGKPGDHATDHDKLLREELRQQLLALTKRGPRPTVSETAKEPSKRRDQGNLFNPKLDDPSGQA